MKMIGSGWTYMGCVLYDWWVHWRRTKLPLPT